MALKFFYCKHCGNIVAMVHDSGVPLVCCGEKMQEIEVRDPGILHDADTPEDFQALLRYHNEQLVRPVVNVSLARELPFFDGKIAMLLSLVDETHSVRTACQRIQISYSTGWNIIRTLESQLSRGLIERSQGGAGGGQSSLTPEGKRFLKLFIDFENEVRDKTAELFEVYFKDVF